MVGYDTGKAYSFEQHGYFKGSHRTLLLPENHCLSNDIEHISVL